MQKWHAWLRWLRTLRFPERVVLISMLLVVGTALGFVAIADEVMEGDSQSIDERVLVALRRADDPSVPIGPVWLRQVARDLTALGGGVIVSLLTGSVLGFLALAGRWRTAALITASVLGGMLASTLLKLSFDRQRPSLVPHLTEVYTSSFPSGHSMMAAATYLTLGAVLAQTTKDRSLRIYFLGMAICLAVLIGLSRIYLGVHYPTDVLAGWCAGVSWALLCSVVARWLQRRGDVEQPAPAKA
jgi:undecaprenyl-diphosphatase